MINEGLLTRTEMDGIRDVTRCPAFEGLPSTANSVWKKLGVEAHHGVRDTLSFLPF